MKKPLKVFYYSLFIIALFTSISFSFTPNPIISKGTGKVITSSGIMNLLNDGKYTYGAGWSITTNNSWAAINVGKGFSKVFICWNSSMDIWSDSLALPWAGQPGCMKNLNMPFEYQILTSDSSTTGADGQWSEAISIKNNVVAGRGHLIDFTGKSWIKMNVTKSSSNAKIDEISVFNALNGLDDSWLFIGTSITQMSSRSPVPSKNFTDFITGWHSSFTPAMIQGGIGCVRSEDVVKDISKYLANAGNVHFWAIEMGTNDAWGGTNAKAASFKSNLQMIIDSCKVHHIEPVIARIIATNPNKTKDGKWQIHPDFLTAVDDLTSQNRLYPGPDFYNYFLKNPTELGDDGIHPSPTGGLSIQRLWAEKMDSLVYQKTSVISSLNPMHRLSSSTFTALSRNNRLVLHADIAGTASIYSINGEMLDKIALRAASSRARAKAPGFYVVRFSCANGLVKTVPVVNR